MPYLGNPVVDRFTSTKAASVYSGDGSTVAFTLEHSVGSDEDILVSVDGVIQEPSVAYAVSSGTTLTFTAAPSNNAGNNIFVYYLFRTIGTVTHPATSALSATSGTFSTTLGVTGASTLGAGLTVANGLTLTDGNLVVASGHGIDFGATGNVSGTSSELLDDYEEGTWTPTIGNFVLNSGTWGGTGRYIKTGKSVTVTFFQTGGNVSWTQGFALQGLPFTPQSGLYGAGSFTNGTPNIGGEILVYNTNNTIYFAQSGSSQTTLVFTVTYILTT